MPIAAADILGRLGFLSREEADHASYGIIKVDKQGQILFINQYCCDLGGFEPEQAEGRDFFTEIAPCTNNRLFMGKFKDGMHEDLLDIEFNYTLTYKIRPTNVRVHLLRDHGTDTNWIFLRRSAPEGLGN